MHNFTREQQEKLFDHGIVLSSILTLIDFTGLCVNLYWFSQLKKAQKELDINYTVSELMNIMPPNTQQTRMVQGVLKPYSTGRQLFKLVTYRSDLNSYQMAYRKQIKGNSFIEYNGKRVTISHTSQVAKIQDLLNEENIAKATFNQDTKYSQSLYDYHQQTKFIPTKGFQAKFHNFMSSILGVFGLKWIAYYTENQVGISFNQQVAILGDVISRDNKLFIENVKYMGRNAQEIKHLFKKQINLVGNRVIVLSCLGVMCTGLIAIFCSLRKNVQKKQPLPTLKNSISKIIQEPTENDSCIICVSKTRSVIFEPCMHFLVCEECYQQLNHKCPVCRTQITRQIKVVQEA